jgi:hypothetical protein
MRELAIGNADGLHERVQSNWWLLAFLQLKNFSLMWLRFFGMVFSWLMVLGCFENLTKFFAHFIMVHLLNLREYIPCFIEC